MPHIDYVFQYLTILIQWHCLNAYDDISNQTMGNIKMSNINQQIITANNRAEGKPAFYRKDGICKRLAISSSTLDRLIKKGIFPAPFVLGEPGYSRSIGWSVEEVDAWIESRPRVQSENVDVYEGGEVIL